MVTGGTSARSALKNGLKNKTDMYKFFSVKNTPHTSTCECLACVRGRVAAAIHTKAFDADLQMTDETGQAKRLREMIEVEPPTPVAAL